jgi:hypothetical protein
VPPIDPVNVAAGHDGLHNERQGMAPKARADWDPRGSRLDFAFALQNETAVNQRMRNAASVLPKLRSCQKTRTPLGLGTNQFPL